MFDSIKSYALLVSNETTKRDWGQSIILREDFTDDGVVFYREKFLIFNPGASIILESHSDYDEIWMPDSTLTYALELNDSKVVKHFAQKHERIFISRDKKHKIINDNSYKLCIFEIQIGTIMNDDKIQYKKEDYGNRYEN
ncbi:MAG: hypothetical protein AAB395_04205 [Patescibacteria group bacterium]